MRQKKIAKPAEPIAEVPMTKFMFVNKSGFRNDSTTHGMNDTVLIAVCLNVKYFDKKANISHLASTCYNRNFPEDRFPLTDSIRYFEYAANLGSSYVYEVELGWKDATTFKTTRAIKFNLASYPSRDTVKVSQDAIVKFTWPDDTASGRFIKTYQYP